MRAAVRYAALLRGMAAGIAVGLLASCSEPAIKRIEDPKFAVNQAGYMSRSVKTAYAAAELETFFIVDAAGRTVLKGRAGSPTDRLGPAEPMVPLDFSSLRLPGDYELRSHPDTPGMPIRVDSTVYAEVLETTLYAYELAKCGVRVDDPVSGVHYDACHLRPAELAGEPGKVIDVSGGWHDAGDFGKYIPSAAFAVGLLLMGDALAPNAMKQFKLRGTAGTGAKLPDWLEVIRTELDWMMKMQRDDGAVYHKVSSSKFPAYILPHRDELPQHVYGVTTTSTAMYAAAMARASTAYAPHDGEYAAELLDAAERAWRFLAGRAPILRAEHDPIPVYYSGDDRDERLWAAAELYAATGKAVYRTAVERLNAAVPRKEQPTVASWENVSTLADFALALPDDNADWGPAREARTRLTRDARELARRAGAHPYGSVLGEQEYVWGSAKNHASYALVMAVANTWHTRKDEARAMVSQMDWILGVNPLGRSFITGIGWHTAANPHNRYSIASGVGIPGLVVGGPNSRAQDGVTPPGRGPLSYVDHRDAYGSNENAIDYNAPVALLAAVIQERYS